ncbi:IF4E2 [Enterospora canceri]|uniref:IF4E2 n=1 Tax=Enterospora canceri TaxID=1081671 RepID=A0A1Y1S4D8_9MICR|nr:IF4E2 [Enterospora canceri]
METAVENNERTFCILQHSNEEGETTKGWMESFVTTGVVTSIPQLNYFLNKVEETKLENLNDIYFFKEGTRPMWEDEQNLNGGRLIYEMSLNSPNILRYLKASLIFTFMGIFPNIVGVACNEKEKNFRICLWIGDSSESEEIAEAWKGIMNAQIAPIVYIPHRKHKEFSKGKFRKDKRMNKF